MSEQCRLPEASFGTSDLHLASFLRCRGFPILDLRDHGGRTVFTFAEVPALHQAVLDYANDGGVGVRSFCSALRDLKGLTRRQATEVGGGR